MACASKQGQALTVSRWPGPSRGLGQVAGRMRVHPLPGQQPAGMGHQHGARHRRLPGLGAGQHVDQTLSTTRCVVRKVSHPDIDLSVRNLKPRLAIPGAKVHLQQARINHMLPAPAFEASAHIATALQGRGAHHGWPAFTPGQAADAAGQSARLARVKGQVGLADAAALVPPRPGVPKSRASQGHGQRTQSTGWITASQASKLAACDNC